MRLLLVTAPTLEPVTLAQARAHCRVTHTGDDDLLTELIVVAREAVESFVGRALVHRTYDLKSDGFPCEWTLPMAPAASVTSITYVDTDGTTQTLAADQYATILAGGTPGCDAGRIVPAYGVVWPVTRGTPEDVTVRFVAGYGAAASAVPSVFKHAIKVMVEDLYEERGSYVTGTIVAALPTAVERLLMPYRTALTLVGAKED